MPTELPLKNVGDHTSTRGISGLTPRVVRGRAHSKGGSVEGVYLVVTKINCPEKPGSCTKAKAPPPICQTRQHVAPLCFFHFFVCVFFLSSANITFPWLELELQRGESEKGSEVDWRLPILQQEVEDNRSAGRGNFVIFHIPTGSKSRKQACGVSLFKA